MIDAHRDRGLHDVFQTGKKENSRFSFWKNWVLSCGTGEFLGISGAAATAVFLNQTLGEPTTTAQRLISLACMVLAGAFEGLCLGYFQWRILKRRYKTITGRSWIGTTVVVAALGWLLGMLPSFLMPSVSEAPPVAEPGYPALVFLGIGSGLVLGSLFGFVQWWILRRHAFRSHRWVLANALGWALGMGWIMLGASLPTERTAMPSVVLVGALSGILGGASFGAVTGLFLLRMPPIPKPSIPLSFERAPPGKTA